MERLRLSVPFLSQTISKNAMSETFSKALSDAREALKKMTPEERVNFFGNTQDDYCRYCGFDLTQAMPNGCSCNNDE